VLTPDGEVARDYAESNLRPRHRTAPRDVRSRRTRRQGLRLGVTDSVPKLLIARVLAPLLKRHRDRHRARMRRGDRHRAARTLAARQLDAVLRTSPRRRPWRARCAAAATEVGPEHGRGAQVRMALKGTSGLPRRRTDGRQVAESPLSIAIDVCSPSADSRRASSRAATTVA